MRSGRILVRVWMCVCDRGSCIWKGISSWNVWRFSRENREKNMVNAYIIFHVCSVYIQNEWIVICLTVFCFKLLGTNDLGGLLSSLMCVMLIQALNETSSPGQPAHIQSGYHTTLTAGLLQSIWFTSALQTSLRTVQPHSVPADWHIMAFNSHIT